MIEVYFAIIIFGTSFFIGYIVGRIITLEWVNKNYRKINGKQD
jgi:TM2 domain-containing membrane protein YozV